MRLAGLELEIKELNALDPAALDDDELQAIVVELHRLSSSLDAARASLVAAFDARRTWADTGARSCAAFLAKETGRPKPECGSQVARARRLRHLPLVADAWAAGDISEAHVRRILAARNPRTALLLERDQAVLVDLAQTLAFHEFEQAMAYWELRADPRRRRRLRRRAPRPAAGLVRHHPRRDGQRLDPPRPGERGDLR